MTGASSDSSSVSPARHVRNSRPERSTSDDSKTALRDPAAVRALHPGGQRLRLSPSVRRRANARKYRDYSRDRKNRKNAAVSRGFVAGGPGFEPRLTESESAVLPLNYPPPAGTRSPTSRRDVRYRASGFVRWRIPEMPPAATDGRLRLQSGPRQATKSPQTRIPSGATTRG